MPVSRESSRRAIRLLSAGLVQAPYELNPRKATFADVKVGETATQRIMIRAAKPFKVIAPADDADGLAVEVFPAATPVQIVTVKFTPTKAGTVNKTITLKTEPAGTVTIPVEAEAIDK